MNGGGGSAAGGAAGGAGGGGRVTAGTGPTHFSCVLTAFRDATSLALAASACCDIHVARALASCTSLITLSSCSDRSTMARSICAIFLLRISASARTASSADL